MARMSAIHQLGYSSKIIQLKNQSIDLQTIVDDKWFPNSQSNHACMLCLPNSQQKNFSNLSELLADETYVFIKSIRSVSTGNW